MRPGPDHLPPLRDVIATHGLAARKSLGQHFLLDTNLTGRIARSIASLDEGTIIEVGPGPGGLTRALLAEGAGRLVAVEKDPRCVAALAPLVESYPGQLELIEDDALAVAFADLGPVPRRVVANLPYNIATPLLLGWLAEIAADSTAYAELVLMFQKEVAERLIAGPGSKSYGRLSVMTQWLCEASILFQVPARAFTPPPKVSSAVIRLKPRARPLAAARMADLERGTAAGFGKRRKMLRRSLQSLGVEPRQLLAAAGIREDLRAENLSVEEFCALARTLGHCAAPVHGE